MNFDDIQRKRREIRNNILKGFGVLMSEEDIEKAHKDGDLHPNGKWVWVSSAAGGKGDWRTLNGRTHKKHQVSGSAGTTGSAGSSSASSGSTVNGSIDGGGKKTTMNKKKQSAFIIKIVNKLKDVIDISDEHIEKLADAMSKDEATAKKIVSVKFPSTGTVNAINSYQEDSRINVINGYDELVCESAKSYVTTSRGFSPYIRTEYTIYRQDGYSGIKKRLSSTSSSTGKYGTTAAKAKQKCIMEALLMYYKNSVYGS